jgi:hypothetical protein
LRLATVVHRHPDFRYRSAALQVFQLNVTSDISHQDHAIEIGHGSIPLLRCVTSMTARDQRNKPIQAEQQKHGNATVT